MAKSPGSGIAAGNALAAMPVPVANLRRRSLCLCSAATLALPCAAKRRMPENGCKPNAIERSSSDRQKCVAGVCMQMKFWIAGGVAIAVVLATGALYYLRPDRPVPQLPDTCRVVAVSGDVQDLAVDESRGFA